MVLRLACIAWVPLVAFACGPGAAPTKAAKDPTPPVVSVEPAHPCGAATLEVPVIVVVEGTVAMISGEEVVADSFMMRWIKPEQGPSEHLASARIVGTNESTSATTGTTLGVGGQLSIGSDRYCIVMIEYPRSEPGTVSLQRIAP